MLRAVPVALRYLITCVLVSAVGWARLSVGDGGEHQPLLVFIPVILLCGAFLDRGNGVLATLLSAAFVAYFIMPPIRQLSVDRLEDQLSLALFVLIGLIITVVVELLHKGLTELAAEHERVRKAGADRTLLLDELSHRTRNDFANVVILLKQQARTSGQEAREALMAAADRVQTIGRVHRRLELRGDRVVVDSKSYIEELSTDLRMALLASRPIGLEHNVESHKIGLEKAVPIGLILNESITNAAKHAFPDDRAGLILVSFIRTGGIYRLTIADNGVGIKEPPREGALGTSLMTLLARQLDSRIEVESRDPGTAVVVSLPAREGNGTHG